MAKQDDGLFFLEVLVDKVIFVKSPCFSDTDFRTCVNIECSAVEPLEICEDDSSGIAKSNSPFIKSFNSGKSCLFSLKEKDISASMSKFPIKVTIYKSLPCGCIPTKIIMGECTIDMTKEFIEARKNFLQDTNKVNYQALKDSFHFFGPDGTETGEILMFLRISCFGKLIVTQFQGTNANMAGSSTIVDRSCTPKKEFQSLQDPCACGAAHSRGAVGFTNASPQVEDPYKAKPCGDPDEPCYCSGPRTQIKHKMACRNTDQYCLHVPKGRTRQYEEIGTNLGGNELKIKVPAGSSVIKKISQTHCSMQRPYAKQKGDALCDPPCGKNQISLALPNEAICCQGARPAGTQFTCTTEGCLQAPKHGQSFLARGDTKTQEAVPPNKDVFVLKVAKTALEGDRKCQMELEFVTPKGPDKRLPIVKANTAIQSNLDCDCCVTRLKKVKGKKNCCRLINKVIPQTSTDFCVVNHKQRAHFHLTLHKLGSVSNDEPGQPMSTTESNCPGNVSHMRYNQDSTKQIKNESKKTTYMYRSGNTVNTAIDELVFYLTRPYRKAPLNINDLAGTPTGMFSKNYLVYTTLTPYYCKSRTYGTQATASLNKCFQVYENANVKTFPSNSNYSSTVTMSTAYGSVQKVPENIRYSQVYFFGKKKEYSKPKGVGIKPSGSCPKPKTSVPTTTSTRTAAIMNDSKTNTSNSNSREGISASLGKRPSNVNTKTSKYVAIHDDKTCPQYGTVKDNLMARISHIRIGPREVCPLHGKDGLKCQVTSSSEEQGQVKITTSNNPRRGVFELVIRRLTGAPLAKNELMLEWTPPPSQTKPCPPVGPVTFISSGRCRQKCKTVLCRPSPCKGKFVRKLPCFTPCTSLSCKRCTKTPCCHKSCRQPSLYSSCRPCSTSPCRSCYTCTYKIPCNTVCNPGCGRPPCIKKCPAGRKRPRRGKSQPKIRSHPKYVSPCLNRSKTCPTVKCRSFPECCYPQCG